MSVLINDLLESIKTRVSTVLGPDFRELPFVIDVSQNNFKQNHNRYGVVPAASFETDSVTKFVTMTHSFDMVLTKAYIDDGIGDSDKRAKRTQLQDLYLDIYKDLVNTKAGIPSIVMNITDLSIDDAVYLEDEKIVVMNASFNVLYRFTLI